jgi:hypothetical protein
MRTSTIAFLALIVSAALTAAGFAYAVELLIVGVPLMLLSAGVIVGTWPSSLDERMAENRTERRRRCPACTDRALKSITHPLYYGLTYPQTARRGR